MDNVLIFKIVGIVISYIIFLAIKGNRELTDEKIKLNLQLLLKQRNSGIIILYLRDFDVDGNREVTVKFGDFESTFIDTNFETELSISAGKIGHFIAIGIKSDTGDVGADRYAVDDDRWQDRVTELMDKSSMILIRPSLSAGLVWELEQIVKNNYLNKTVICYHREQDGRDNYNYFRDVISHLINLPSAYAAWKFMYIDDKRNILGYERLEETPIFINIRENANNSE